MASVHAYFSRFARRNPYVLTRISTAPRHRLKVRQETASTLEAPLTGGAEFREPMRRIFTRRRPQAGRFIVILLLAAGGLLATAVLTGAVLSRTGQRIQVIDAGTLQIDGARRRLFGIDAPGPAQTCRDADGAIYACGRRAAAFVTRALAGKPVTCDAQRPRTAVVCYADGSDVAAALVRAGWAVHEAGTFLYLADERQAQAAGRGMWAGSFTRPSQWRRQNAAALPNQSG